MYIYQEKKYSLFSREKSNFIKSDILLPVNRDKMSNVFPVTEKNTLMFLITSHFKLCLDIKLKKINTGFKINDFRISFFTWTKRPPFVTNFKTLGHWEVSHRF